jgi:outer membrane lipoprotein-sorting protein
MGTAEKLEILIKQFLKTKTSAALSSEKDNTIFNDAMAAFEKSKTGKKAILPSTIFRIAAVIIIFVSALAIVHFRKENDSNLLSKAIARIQNADTLIYDVQTNSKSTALKTKWSLTKAGYIQIDSDAANFAIILDTNKMKGIGIIKSAKKSIEIEMPNINNNTKAAFVIINKLISLPAQKLEHLGKKQINGKTAEGFCSTDKNSIIKIWIDRDSKLTVQIEIQSADKPLVNIVATNFQINPKIEKPSFENYEKLPIRLNVESWMANEFYLNEFFASLTELNKDKNIFVSVNNQSNLTGIAMRLQEKNSLANYNFEFVCP